jgi:hypothetical protein
MPGHSPSKTGVDALVAGHPRLQNRKQDVDGWDKPGHDEVSRWMRGRKGVTPVFAGHARA